MTAATNELKPVLVFDSGIGGLTVLREARVLMPERGFIYIADDAGFPFGGWEEQALKERIIGLFAKLLGEYDPEVCIIACNTAFTLVGADLRAAFPEMTFVGTVPAIKPAAERTRSGLVSVLATPGTVKRAYTRDLIQSFAQQCHVRLVGSENLARMAEAYIRGEAVSDEELASWLREVTEANVPELLPWLPLIGIVAGVEFPRPGRSSRPILLNAVRGWRRPPASSWARSCPGPPCCCSTTCT